MDTGEASLVLVLESTFGIGILPCLVFFVSDWGEYLESDEKHRLVREIPLQPRQPPSRAFGEMSRTQTSCQTYTGRGMLVITIRVVPKSDFMLWTSRRCSRLRE